MAHASGYLKTSYGQGLQLLETKLAKAALAALIAILLVYPLIASPFFIDLANMVFLAVVAQPR